MPFAREIVERKKRCFSFNILFFLVHFLFNSIFFALILTILSKYKIYIRFIKHLFTLFVFSCCNLCFLVFGHVYLCVEVDVVSGLISFWVCSRVSRANLDSLLIRVPFNNATPEPLDFDMFNLFYFRLIVIWTLASFNSPWCPACGQGYWQWTEIQRRVCDSTEIAHWTLLA